MRPYAPAKQDQSCARELLQLRFHSKARIQCPSDCCTRTGMFTVSRIALMARSVKAQRRLSGSLPLHKLPARSKWQHFLNTEPDWLSYRLHRSQANIAWLILRRPRCLSLSRLLSCHRRSRFLRGCLRSIRRDSPDHRVLNRGQRARRHVNSCP